MLVLDIQDVLPVAVQVNSWSFSSQQIELVSQGAAFSHVQVAEERERARKLAEKLAAARHASSAAAARAQLASVEDARCKANQHAEHLRQARFLC